jgi:septum site-determining protein MinC
VQFTMPVQPDLAFSASDAPAFELKSAQLTLVALIVKTSDLAKLAAELLKKFGPNGESPDFFDTDGLVLDFSQAGLSLPHPQWNLLLNTLTQCRLVASAVRGLDESSLAVAKKSGVAEAPPEIRRPVTAKASPVAAPPAVTPVTAPSKASNQAASPLVVAPAARDGANPTMVVNKPLRSGQKVYARGADLIVMAMVNRGAEVIADGNIHVYAPLRGKAMAGARGNTSARIFALALEPELVSIAGVYRTTEQELGPDVLGKPAQVRLSDDGKEKIIIEALKT